METEIICLVDSDGGSRILAIPTPAGQNLRSICVEGISYRPNGDIDKMDRRIFHAITPITEQRQSLR